MYMSERAPLTVHVHVHAHKRTSIASYGIDILCSSSAICIYTSCTFVYVHMHARVHTHHTFQSVSISICMRLSVTVTWNHWCQHWPPASLSTAGTSTTRPLWWWPVAMDDSMWLDSFWREGKDSSLVQWTPLYLGSLKQGCQNTISCPCYFEKCTNSLWNKDTSLYWDTLCGLQGILNKEPPL